MEGDQLTTEQREESAIMGTPATPVVAPTQQAQEPVTPEPAAAPEQQQPGQQQQEPEFDPNAPIPLDFSGAEPAQEKIEIAPEAEQQLLKRFEKYKVQSLEELEARISGSPGQDVVAEYQSRIAQLEQAAQSANPFANDAQRKLFDFAIKHYDGTNLDSIAEFGRLHSMDLDKMPNKQLMLEAFILDNKKMDRSEAVDLFEIKYKRNYDISALDKEHDIEQIREKQLEEKYAAQQAKEKIAKVQSDFKPTVSAPKTEEVPQVVSEAVKRTVAGVQDYVKNLSVVKVATGDKPEHFFNVSVPEAEVKKIADALSEWASTAANYDKDGNLYGPKDPSGMANMVMYGSMGQKLIQLAYQRGLSDKERAYVEQNKVQKSSQSINSGASVSTDNLSDEQKEEMAIMGKK